MTYDKKVAKAQSIIEAYNSSLPETSKKQILVDEFFYQLREAGGTTAEALALCTWEDIEDFGEKAVRDHGANFPFPKLLARQIAKIFRGKDKSSKPAYLSRHIVDRMDLQELVGNYDPKIPNEFVKDRLAKIVTKSGAPKPCLVFTDSGTLNKNATLRCVEDIVAGYPAVEMVIIGGIPYKTYIVGDRPESLIDENPLMPGHALVGAEQLCHLTYRSWKEISLDLRQIIYLALTETKEIQIDSPSKIHDIFDLVSDRQKITVRCHKAVILFKEKKRNGSLPSLKISRKLSGESSKKQNPFKHKSY